jgi:phosphoglycerate dehydrogenase-like enzyme
MTKIAILDDSQHVAADAADWNGLRTRGVEIVVIVEPFASEDAAAAALADCDVIVPMRERTPFPASLIARLPKLRLVALTGGRAPTLDIAACTQHGVLVCNTGGGEFVTAATAELTWGLLLAAKRHLPQADVLVRGGGWHDGLPMGESLEGKRLGVVGLGKLGARVARFGQAFGMDVVAWSQNLTDETAAAGGARRVTKEELFATADAVTLHLVLSDRSRGIVGAPELEAMKQGAVLINTSRGPLIEEAALLAALRRGGITAALDVFGQEPLPADHPLRSAPNTVLSPHLGYSTWPVMRRFYQDSVENIVAWIDGAPIRMLNPDAAPANAEPRQ